MEDQNEGIEMSVGQEDLEKVRIVMALENFMRELKQLINKGNQSQHDFIVEPFCQVHSFKSN